MHAESSYRTLQLLLDRYSLELEGQAAGLSAELEQHLARIHLTYRLAEEHRLREGAPTLAAREAALEYASSLGLTLPQKDRPSREGPLRRQGARRFPPLSHRSHGPR